MDAVGQVTGAVKSAFSLKTLIAALVAFLLLAALFDFFGVSKWLLQPFSAAKEKFGKAASVLIVFATAAAATATNWMHI